MAQLGSSSEIAVNALSASSYQNECKVQTAWLNRRWLSREQEVGKLTSPDAMPSEACTA
jgi:hypothetical protein